MAESCGEGSKFRRMGGTVIIALTANATEDDRTRLIVASWSWNAFIVLTRVFADVLIAVWTIFAVNR